MVKSQKYVYFKTKDEYDEGNFTAFFDNETDEEITKYLTQWLAEDGEQLDFWYFVTKKQYDELVL